MLKIDNLDNVSQNEGFKHYAIVRSYKDPKPNVIQMSTLAPSIGLYHQYLEWRDDHEWNYEKFTNEYVPRFIKELKSDQYGINALAMLYDESFKQNIALYCFCPVEQRCHRSIVGGILLGSGANIQCDPEYAKYWQMFRQM